jgi:hypothetical protein
MTMHPCSYDFGHYVVKVSCAKTPSSWKWKHRRTHVAVMHVDSTVDYPRMISERARGVRRIVEFWGAQYDGPSVRCQAYLARTKAEDMAEELNEALARECTGEGMVSL